MSRSAVAPAAGIESLPLDVLGEVLAYAPVAARIKTVSLVCKRWRTAALRSVRFFKLKATTNPAARVPGIFSLFPSLTDLSLVTCLPNWTLPASLLRLSLGRDQLQAAAAAEERGEPTFLSARFPHLSALSLHLPLFHKPSLVPLIAAHSSQLTFLSLRSLTRPLAAIVCTLPWPKLHTLQLTFPSDKKTGIILSAMPSLSELRLRLAYPLRDLADESLTALKRLTLASCGVADLTRLQRLCPDCVLSVSVPRPCENSALESRFLASVMLESHEWQWLAQFRTVESLIITRPLPAPAPVSLPHLRRVAVKCLPLNEALAAALSILRMHRSVRTLAVELPREGYHFGDAEQTLLDDFAATAVSLAVRKIVLYIPDPPSPAPPAVCRDGWLRLRRVFYS